MILKCCLNFSRIYRFETGHYQKQQEQQEQQEQEQHIPNGVR
jgi:hypothetical protein